ncbi:MAG: selenide, water dikinase SelD [Verrucomicrobiales bacterium]
MDSTASTPLAKDLVLIGGGHSHAIVLRIFGMKPLAGIRVTLVSDAAHAPYSGMLPGHIAGFYSRDEMHIDLRRLCQVAGARFVHARLIGLNLARRRVLLADRPPLSFDVVSINTGSTPAENNVAGAAEFATPAKPVSGLLEKWDAICSEVKAAHRPRILVVGGGAGGVELALTMQARLESLTGHEIPFTVVHGGNTLLPGHNRRVRALLAGELESRGVRVLVGQRIIEVRAGAAVFESGAVVEADHVFWVTDAAPPPWLRSSGLKLDDRGFAAVSDTLQSLSHEFVFAVGDVATVTTEPRPKSGVFAVRAARPLAENLRRYFEGDALVHWRPQQHFLSLIGTGRGEAVVSRRWLAMKGRWCWRLKDWIDRRFMRRFEDLPGTQSEAAAGRSLDRSRTHGVLAPELQELQQRAHMRCFGCAAKIGDAALRRVMDRLRDEFGAILRNIENGKDILVGLDQPDDAAAFMLPAGRALVQTVDYMPALVSDPHVFARIATLHCFSDIFAMGAEPHSALLTALLPFGAESLTEETLYQVMSGVLVELQKFDALLIGGHSAEGAVLGIALTCNGMVEPRRLLRKSGLVAGQALILTKALGIGVLFAAEMRLAAQGEWIEGAIASMLRSNQFAAAALREHGATALTDITGFGLAGHALEMCRASNVSAVFDLRRIPALPGAEICAGKGFLSSLHPQNSRATSALPNASEFAHHSRFPLLFDPQTSGGLLAGIPADRAEACMQTLRVAGLPDACVIGCVTTVEGGQTQLVLEGARS